MRERVGKAGDGTDLEGSAEDAEFDERHGDGKRQREIGVQVEWD